MPWRERSLMDVRLRFVQDVHRPGWSIAEVCRRYQVSRKTGYKWLEHYEKAGPAGLVDRSHRPYSCPHATPGPIVQQILTLQRRFRWGARKFAGCLPSASRASWCPRSPPCIASSNATAARGAAVLRVAALTPAAP